MLLKKPTGNFYEVKYSYTEAVRFSGPYAGNAAGTVIRARWAEYGVISKGLMNKLVRDAKNSEWMLRDKNFTQSLHKFWPRSDHATDLRTSK